MTDIYNTYPTNRLITEVELRSIRTYRQCRSLNREQLITLLDNHDNRRSQGTY